MSCIKRAKTAIAIFKAILSRVLFALHGFICIWRVTVVKGQPLYWCLTGTFPVMVIETVFTIKQKRGGEWKWFTAIEDFSAIRVCPSVLLYLGTAVPAIWFLELDLMAGRMAQSSQDLRNTTNEDSISVLTDQLKISLGREEWCKILEQMLLLILIIGRWLLPKGEITREQLSQLLLVYIGMAADIIELFEAFKEEGVRENYLLTIIILSLWTASLTQFTFVVTATKAKRMRPVLFKDGSRSAINIAGRSCCPTEVLSILISVMLQDGPFLVLRMLLIFRYDVLSYTNLFFTSKNTLVLVLQFYRLVVLFTQRSSDHPAATTIIISKDDNGVLDRDLLFGSGADVRLARSRERERGTASVSDPVTPSDSYYRDEDDGEAEMSEYEDDIMNATEFKDKDQENKLKMPQRETPTSVRRQSFKRQKAAAPDSPHTSTERECDSIDNGICNTGTLTSMSSLPHSMSDAEVLSIHRGKGKGKGERRKISSDSTRGSMSDSREDVRKGEGKPRGMRRQRSAKEHWKNVQTFTRAIAFVNEAGKHKTIVLKPVETVDKQTVYFLQSDFRTGKKI